MCWQDTFSTASLQNPRIDAWRYRKDAGWLLRWKGLGQGDECPDFAKAEGTGAWGDAM